MNTLVIVLIAAVCLFGAYMLYGRWLANKWGIDPAAKTPAVVHEDGRDYVPTNGWTVFAHQFSSIAGAGPVTGAIQAAAFGWLPVLLWVLIDWNRLAGAAGGSIAFGLLFVCLLFGCVLLHELGHAFMAMHYGIRVHDVTLSVIGGVARMGRRPVDPRAEAAIALSGPVVNVSVAVLLAPWVILLGVSAAAVVGAVVYRKREK